MGKKNNRQLQCFLFPTQLNKLQFLFVLFLSFVSLHRSPLLQTPKHKTNKNPRSPNSEPDGTNGLALEQYLIGQIHQGLQAPGAELPSEQEWVGPVPIRPFTVPRPRRPQPLHQLRLHLVRLVRPGMPVGPPGPIDVRQRGGHTPVRVRHAQHRREIVLLRVASIRTVTRTPEMVPQDRIVDHQQGVFPVQDEKLRPDPKSLKRDIGQHRPGTPGRVPDRHARLRRQDLDVALRRRPAAREVAVDGGEGAEGDAGGREESEHGVGGVVEEGVGEEAAGGGDEGGVGAAGGGGGDDLPGENAGERLAVGLGGVGVDVDVEEVGGIGKEAVPERGEGERGGGEEEEGKLGGFRVVAGGGGPGGQV